MFCFTFCGTYWSAFALSMAFLRLAFSFARRSCFSSAVSFSFFAGIFSTTALLFFFSSFSLRRLSLYSAFSSFIVCFNALSIHLLIVLEAIFFTSLKLTYYDVSKPYMSYITLAINILQLIFEFVLLLNPKYKNFHKMVRIDAETFSRPKINYLACLEWGTFINLLKIIF